jgi:hypothetical protein
MTVFTERCPLDRWPDVPASYILGTADRAVSPQWPRRISRELLGAEAIELGTGHSSFLADPDGLVDALLRASRF